MTFQVEVFRVVKPFNVVVGYQCLRGPCSRHLQGVGGGGDDDKTYIKKREKNSIVTFEVRNQ
jgi:hypothetical protein